jgi:hypothetical protein
MRQRLTIIFLFVSFSAFTQDIPDKGNWFYLYTKKEPQNHWSQPMPFPQSAADYAGQLVYSAKEKSKMGAIVDALKEVYPRPKLNSYFIDLVALFNSAKMDKTKIPIRDYRFGYRVAVFSRPMEAMAGKVVKKDFKWEWYDDATLDFVTVNVNYIPDFLGGWGFEYDGPKINLEKHFTYQEINGKESNQPKDLNLGYVVSITSNDESFTEAQKSLGSNYGVPSLNFGNDADKYFVFRKFSSSSILNGKKFESKEPRHKIHTVENMVILTHNDKMPLIPLTIETYLNLCDKICAERIASHKLIKVSNADDYNKNKKHYDDLEAKLIAEEVANTEFIKSLRQEYKSRFQEQAIVNFAYQHVFEYRNYASYGKEISNKKTNKYDPQSLVVKNFFIKEPKLGKAYYSYDKDYYKNMADGEIRTMAVIWRDIIRAPDHPDFGKGNRIENNSVNESRYTDNPDFYLHYFQDKFRWGKLEAIMGRK